MKSFYRNTVSSASRIRVCSRQQQQCVWLLCSVLIVIVIMMMIMMIMVMIMTKVMRKVMAKV